MTASDIHRKIQEISSKYISGRPPIAIESLCSELGISEPDVQEHLKHLSNLGLICHDSNSITITKAALKQGSLK